MVKIEALSPLFSPRVTRHLISSSGVDTVRGILYAAGLSDLNLSTVESVLNHSFRLLSRSGNRDDYVYRSAIIQKLVLGKHSLNTATILNEFRTEKSIVDVGVINGTLTAYEIKSDRDSLKRLQTQLEDYAKFFRKVYVVASEHRAEKVLQEIPEHVGVLSLTNRQTLKMLRESSDLLLFNDPKAICNSLRLNECFDVLAAFGIEKPVMPNSMYRKYLWQQFKELPISDLSEVVRGVLLENRRQKKSAEKVMLFPKYLRALALTSLQTEKELDLYLETLEKAL